MPRPVYAVLALACYNSVMNDPANRLSLSVHRDHRRAFEDNFYVYPVVSRRSKGVSVGINLNPDTLCNFDCVYCQVDRVAPPRRRDVEAPRLLAELENLLDLVQSGELFEVDRFRATPARLRRLNDIAFSGDGEPTTAREFPEVVERVAEIKRRRGLESAKLVLITNATRLHHPPVREALRVLDANQGEIWAKLDAGTEEYYRQVERTTIPLQRVLDNIAEAARERSIVIQSMFLKMHGQGPPKAELAEYCGRLNDIVAGGGRIHLVQVYTVARRPPADWITPLSDAEVDAIVDRVRRSTGLAAEAYYSS